MKFRVKAQEIINKLHEGTGDVILEGEPVEEKCGRCGARIVDGIHDFSIKPKKIEELELSTRWDMDKIMTEKINQVIRKLNEM